MMTLNTTTPEETRDAIVAWLRNEAEFHRDTIRLCGGKRGKDARRQEADLIESLADSLTKYKTPTEASE